MPRRAQSSSSQARSSATRPRVPRQPTLPLRPARTGATKVRPANAPPSLGQQALRWVSALGAAVLIANAFIGERGWLATSRARQAHLDLANDIAQLQHENWILVNEARRLRDDPAAIEELARSELGLIRRGERMFIFTDRAGVR